MQILSSSVLMETFVYSWWFWLIHQRTQPSCSPAVISPGVTVLLGGEPSGLSEVSGAQEQAFIQHLHSLLLEMMVWGGGDVQWLLSSHHDAQN